MPKKLEVSDQPYGVSDVAEERSAPSGTPRGFVLLCDDETESECLERLLLGAPRREWDRISQIKKGDTLFLLNYRSNLLHGVFEAVTDAALNLEPSAFRRRFPAQVKVRTKLHCPPADIDVLLPLIRRKWIEVSPNGILMFPAQLDSKFLDELYSIFLRIPRESSATRDVHYLVNKAKDGHLTHSSGERQIDDWLHNHLYGNHVYRALISREEQEIISDWYLPEIDLYIEYWENPRGDETNAMHLKHLFYRTHSLRTIDIFVDDLPQVDHIMTKKIRELEPNRRFKRPARKSSA